LVRGRLSREFSAGCSAIAFFLVHVNSECGHNVPDSSSDQIDLYASLDKPPSLVSGKDGQAKVLRQRDTAPISQGKSRALGGSAQSGGFDGEKLVECHMHQFHVPHD